MKAFKNNRWLQASLVVSTMLIARGMVDAQDNPFDHDDDNDGAQATPPGLYVTPTAPLTGAIQQMLNPGLTNYPDYVAGEAVKAVVSPDGKTLAILTAGFNSLYKP